MPNETSPPHFLDAVKASAAKMKEKQSALDARAKELDALKARLDAERADLDARAAKLTSDREAFEREREGLEDVRASMERDLAAIDEGRDEIAKDQERVQRALKALEERERTMKGDEERVERLEQAFAAGLKESETKLHDLLERGENLMKLQANWLATFEGHQKELRAISGELQASQNEMAQQQDSLAVLKHAMREEVNGLLAEHEKLATKERSILEAEKYLASALQIEGADLGQEEVPAARPPPPPPAPPESVAAPPVSESAPEPVPAAVVVSVQEPKPPEPEAGPRATKADAMERLTQAIESWKRARDAGWKVTDIRKTVKVARDAIETGDFDRAIHMAAEILEGLQAPAPAR